MHKVLLTTVFLLPLAGVALAQTTETPVGSQTEGMAEATATETIDGAPTRTKAEAAATAALQAEMATSEKIVREQAAHELRMDWISAATVTSPDGTEIGQVRDLIVNAESGQMIAAIIGVGGFLGIGEKQIAVPWNQLTVNSDAQTITTELIAEEAQAAPDYVFRKRETAPAEVVTPSEHEEEGATEITVNEMETETEAALPSPEEATETEESSGTETH